MYLTKHKNSIMLGSHMDVQVFEILKSFVALFAHVRVDPFVLSLYVICQSLHTKPFSAVRTWSFNLHVDRHHVPLKVSVGTE